MPTYSMTVASGQMKLSGTTVSTGSSLMMYANGLVLALAVFDNLTATTPTVSSITKPSGQANDWQKVGGWDSPQSGSAAGVRGEVWALKTTTAVTQVLTMTLSAAVTAKAFVALSIRDSAESSDLQIHDIVSQQGGDAISLPMIKAGEMAFELAGQESNTQPAVFNWVVDSQAYGTSATAGVATSGQGAASNVAARIMWPSTWPNGLPASDDGSSVAQSSTTIIDGGRVLAVIGPPRQSLTPVSASQGTSWSVQSSVATTRSTTWAVAENLAPVSASRATTWAARAGVASSQSTTWSVRSPRTALRSTTWAARVGVAGSRNTFWGNLTGVAPATRASTWAVRAGVTAQRSSLWHTQTGVTRQRAATWSVLASVAPKSVSTLWAIKDTEPVTASRAASWATHAGVTGQRAAIWVTRAPASAQRATAWGVLSARAATRSTIWGTRSVVPSVVRTTSWSVLRAAASARSTTWSLEAQALSVSASRSTSWTTNAFGQVAAARATVWASRAVVVPGSRATTWAVLSGRQRSVQTHWRTRQLVAATRSTAWSARAVVAVVRATRWETRTAVEAASRETTWFTDAPSFGGGVRVGVVGRDVVVRGRGRRGPRVGTAPGLRVAFAGRSIQPGQSQRRYTSRGLGGDNG